jgi:two-component system chemotaxis response regulator CheY
MKPILVVDDSPTIRRMVKVALSDLATGGFTEAGSGLEAIEKLTLSSASLMVLDLNMPDMHGLEVLRFLRRHPTYRSLPVIVLTTRGDEAGRESAIASGASLYLTKPFAPSVLAEHARAVLEGPRPRREEEPHAKPS